MKKAILLAVWGAGTSYARQILAGFEKVCSQRFAGWNVRWAFNSEIGRARLSSLNCKSDSTKKALLKLYFEKFDSIAIQPLQVIPGGEYAEVEKTCREYALETGMHCATGLPLLNTRQNMQKVARGLLKCGPEQRSMKDKLIFIGHGSKSPGAEWYDILNNVISREDKNSYITTLDKKNEVLNKLDFSEKVWLMPFFALPGKHTFEDIAGGGSNSWKTFFSNSGIKCCTHRKSLLELPPISELWLENLQNAINKLQ